MNIQIYVVVKKYNHIPAFPPLFVHSPVVTWNAGSLHIEGVFTTYPVKYAYNSEYEIHGPFQLQESETFPRYTSFPRYPFDFNRGY